MAKLSYLEGIYGETWIPHELDEYYFYWIENTFTDDAMIFTRTQYRKWSRTLGSKLGGMNWTTKPIWDGLKKLGEKTYHVPDKIIKSLSEARRAYVDAKKAKNAQALGIAIAAGLTIFGMPGTAAAVLAVTKANADKLMKDSISAAASRRIQDPDGFSEAVTANDEPSIGIFGGFEATSLVKYMIPLMILGGIVFYLVYKG